MKILVTGAAGFIGYHLCVRLLQDGHEVVGIDNLNDYYNPDLKEARLANLGIIRSGCSYTNSKNTSLTFYKIDLANLEDVEEVFSAHSFDIVCNLAAQAGVRYSLKNPHSYIRSNINGFMNILECCRNYNVRKLVYASSSSVYGNNLEVPFRTTDNVDKPVSLYAATKRSNELMAHAYNHLYGIETIGLRFFTVYGPWGRPDMAYFSFTEAILQQRTIKIFNNGELYRDFTYIDDIINGVMLILTKIPKVSKESHRIYNIGNNQPVKLLDFINDLEEILESEAIKEMVPMQPGDVNITYADISNIQADYGYSPSMDFKQGLECFAAWYSRTYQVKILNPI